MDYKYNHEIHDKAIEILETKKYKSDCLDAGICPKCGDKLNINRDDHGFSDGGMVCTGCREVYFR